MSHVRLAKNIDILDAVQDETLSPLQVNLIMALHANKGSADICTLIETVRRTNAVSYRFVLDTKFYSAVATLCKKGYAKYAAN